MKKIIILTVALLASWGVSATEGEHPIHALIKEYSTVIQDSYNTGDDVQDRLARERHAVYSAVSNRDADHGKDYYQIMAVTALTKPTATDAWFSVIGLRVACVNAGASEAFRTDPDELRYFLVLCGAAKFANKGTQSQVDQLLKEARAMPNPVTQKADKDIQSLQKAIAKARSEYPKLGELGEKLERLPSL